MLWNEQIKNNSCGTHDDSWLTFGREAGVPGQRDEYYARANTYHADAAHILLTLGDVTVKAWHAAAT